MMAWVEMLRRDLGRLSDCRDRMNIMPLGAAALAGTTFPVDRNYTADCSVLTHQRRIRWMLFLIVILLWSLCRRLPLSWFTSPACQKS